MFYTSVNDRTFLITITELLVGAALELEKQMRY